LINRYLKYYAIIFLFFLVQGCDIFETRTPEDPSQQSSTFIQPTTPDIVITNFKNSIEEYSVDNYVRCLVDAAFSDKNFEFVPSQEAGIDGVIFQGWNRDSERQYLLNIGKPQFGSAGLILTNKRITNVTSDSVVYNFDYVLYYPHNRENYPKSFSGNLQFYLAVDQNRNWSIFRWMDFKTTSPNTWSYLKAIFSSGL